VFVVCGLNHKTAPIRVREQLAPPVAHQDALMNRLSALPSIHEVALLSTCNRTEFYCNTDDPEHLMPWLAREHHLSADDIAPYMYTHHDNDALQHLLRVASGLDSMMIGEPQILGQMKQAYQKACQLGTIGTQLRQIFPFVFRASKRIRTQSGVGNNPVSVAYAAAQLVSQRFSEFSTLTVLIIGSGETSALVAKYLHQQGVQHFMIASRTHEHAKHLAAVFTGKAFTITDIPSCLPKADVIISATACPLPFINKPLVAQALTERHHAPMFFLDLAVPRDIEPDVADLSDVHLYNIDDLHTLIQQGMHERHVAARHAEELIEQELEDYTQWHRSLSANSVISDYRAHMQQLAQHELQRAMQKLSAGHCQFSVLTEFSDRLVNKLTHTPTVGLRRAARDSRHEILDLAHYLFNTPVDTLSS
jgi:glutamyl-tRNA reductase